jgi:hypothetical protein
VAWSFANCPHPAILSRELAQNPAQRKASQYMLFFRGPQAEQALAANNYAGLVDAVLGEGLKTGVFTAADKQAYFEAWSLPGALTGELNYCGALGNSRKAGAGEPAHSRLHPLADRSTRLTGASGPTTSS